MIDLSPKKRDDTSEQLTEGSLTTALKDAAKDMADIDIDAYKAATKDTGHNILNQNVQAAANDNILDPARNTLDAIAKNMNQNRVDNRSLIARAKNSIVQFPIYVTQTLPTNAASIISRQFERYYVTLLQTAIAQDPIIDEEEANNLMWLRKYHANIKEAADTVGVEFSNLYNEFYNPIDDHDAMMRESIFYRERLSESVSVEFRVVPTTDPDLMAECVRLNNEPLTGFTYLREETVKEAMTRNNAHKSDVELTARNITLTDDDFRDMAIDRLKLSAEDGRLVKATESEIRSHVDNTHPYDRNNDLQRNAHDKELKKQMDRRNMLIKQIDDEIEKIKDDIKAGKVPRCAFDGSRYIRQDVTSKSGKKDNSGSPVSSPVILKDGDIKKTNDMLPYTMEVMFRIRSKNGIERDVRYIIGIKAILHIVHAKDLADDLQDLVTGKIKSLRKVKYRTGEMNFKDYFFNIHGIKKDVAKRLNKNRRWIANLKHLADYENMYGSYLKRGVRSLTGGNIPIPNATLVLTQTDVTMLSNATGIDLSVISNASKLVDNLFMLALCIVNPSDSEMRVLFRKAGNWEVESLSSIEAELNKTDNSKLMAELNKIVNR